MNSYLDVRCASCTQSGSWKAAGHETGAMGKRKDMDPSPEMDARAQQLRAQVEAMARQPDGGDSGNLCGSSGSGSISHNLTSARGVSQAADLQLPMLVRSTEAGVYIKWSLMLQDQLARVKDAYDTLKGENIALRQRLAHEGVSKDEETPSVGADYSLGSSRQQSFTSGSGSSSREPSAARTELAGFTYPANSCADPRRAGSSPESGRPGSDCSAGQASSTSDVACNAANALVVLSSPKQSPVERGAAAASCSAVPVAAAQPRLQQPSRQPAAMQYPAASAPMKMQASQQQQATRGDVHLPEGIFNAAWSPGPTDSPGGLVGALSENDELLADLLASPNFLSSPHMMSQMGVSGGVAGSVAAMGGAMPDASMMSRIGSLNSIAGSLGGESPLGTGLQRGVSPLVPARDVQAQQQVASMIASQTIPSVASHAYRRSGTSSKILPNPLGRGVSGWNATGRIA